MYHLGVLVLGLGGLECLMSRLGGFFSWFKLFR